MVCPRGDNLGQRLESVAEHVFSLGFNPFVVLGADSPTLPTTFIQEALSSLTSDQADITLGPTDDGGYYLGGLQRPVPRLFENVDWSTSLAYRQTAANLLTLNLRPHTLPDWYDVDMPADLERLREQILSDAKCISVLRTLIAGWWITLHQSHKCQSRSKYSTIHRLQIFRVIRVRRIKSPQPIWTNTQPVQQLHDDPAAESNRKPASFKTAC